ncbi:Josephin-domain-containing protein [Cokeromyces recurvatus]|uniref:Josephin-domain-containing protein n=1 Tax=Cokeromyces recurvatus TaxID=90255 RepID=UPI00221FA867|nr:Josephin-domain-containing protein [Cokeromyces recurvatus]KAI7906098.1 Josephin-domain-containing protein [Cokeromyces recurvatus]
MCICFEKQEQDLLCAQHALNALLQGNYFTAVDLAEIGKEIDKAEQLVSGSLGKESQNYDDSGYFSIQVLQKALEIWNLELVPWKSKEMEEVRKNPVNQRAYVCNLRNHWFTLRRFNHHWYNLDSMQAAPTYLGENYLPLMLDQIEREGYSVFAVKGELVECPADREAKPLSSKSNETNTTEAFSGRGYSLLSSGNTDNDLLDDEDQMLARAIEESIKDSTNIENDLDEIRRKRLARFGG